jgi:hypothetical protein
MLTGVHYQNAYITRDIEKAVELFKDRLGVNEASFFEVEVDIWTPAGIGKAKNKLAFIWKNNLQYELIQPVDGFVDIYSNALPCDDSLKFHHICMRVDEWSSFRENVEKMQYPVVLEGGNDQLRYLYLDATAELGHYLEYTWMTEERWRQIGGC